MLFGAVKPWAMEYVKFKQGCFGFNSYFRFGHDYYLAMSWIYAQHRGRPLISKRIKTTHDSSAT